MCSSYTEHIGAKKQRLDGTATAHSAEVAAPTSAMDTAVGNGATDACRYPHQVLLETQPTDEELAWQLHGHLNSKTRRRAGCMDSQQPGHCVLADVAGHANDSKPSQQTHSSLLESMASAPAADGQQYQPSSAHAPLRKRNLLLRELQMLAMDLTEVQLQPSASSRRAKAATARRRSEAAPAAGDGGAGQQACAGSEAASAQPAADHAQSGMMEASSSQNSEQEQLDDHSSQQFAGEQRVRDRDVGDSQPAAVEAVAGSMAPADMQLYVAVKHHESPGSGDATPPSPQGTNPAVSGCPVDIRSLPPGMACSVSLIRGSAPAAVMSAPQARQPPQRPPPAAQAPAAASARDLAGIRIPKLPMVMYERKWYRAKVLRDGSTRVLLEFQGYVHKGGPFWLPRDSERLWRGSYKGRDWKYLGDGAWEPRPAQRKAQLHKRDSRSRAGASACRQPCGINGDATGSEGAATSACRRAVLGSQQVQQAQARCSGHEAQSWGNEAAGGAAHTTPAPRSQAAQELLCTEVQGAGFALEHAHSSNRNKEGDSCVASTEAALPAGLVAADSACGSQKLLGWKGGWKGAYKKRLLATAMLL